MKWSEIDERAFKAMWDSIDCDDTEENNINAIKEAHRKIKIKKQVKGSYNAR